MATDSILEPPPQLNRGLSPTISTLFEENKSSYTDLTLHYKSARIRPPRKTSNRVRKRRQIARSAYILSTKPSVGRDRLLPSTNNKLKFDLFSFEINRNCV